MKRSRLFVFGVVAAIFIWTVILTVDAAFSGGRLANEFSAMQNAHLMRVIEEDRIKNAALAGAWLYERGWMETEEFDRRAVRATKLMDAGKWKEAREVIQAQAPHRRITK
jgi:hypothetical protein